MSIDTLAPASVLEWDSAFFGLRIARVTATALTDADACACMDWARASGIDCLYWLGEAADAGSIAAAEHAGFRLVDIRTTFERATQPHDTTLDVPAIREMRPDDLPHLRALAARSHFDTRFYRDGGFARERCDALYATWIEKSCTGGADIVLVAEHAGQVAGYVTGHLHGAEANLGLIAVDEAAQGHGLGTRLTQAFLQWAAGQQAQRSTVVTQAHNIRAQRLYQRAGFVTARVQLWYHGWDAVQRARHAKRDRADDA